MRRRMLPDLIRQHGLVGMDRREVEALLGPPDHEQWSDLYPYPGYNLGSKKWGDSDSTPLLIEYSPQGAAVRIVVP